MNLKLLKSKLSSKKAFKSELSPLFGRITKVSPTIIYANGLNPKLGDLVGMQDELKPQLGMVILAQDGIFGISPFNLSEGLRVGDKVFLRSDGLKFPIGHSLLGRVVDPLGNPIDGKEALQNTEPYPIINAPIAPLQRHLIDQPFETSIRAIDGLLTCGKGQKIGIFAGSGGGKSTLLSMIIKGAEFLNQEGKEGDKKVIKVIALIGERGREVPEFIQKNLHNNLENTIIVVATSDDSALMRKYGAFYAISIAEFFKNQGFDVLFVMDSITRFAMAQREIGLSLGEPPTTKGYPPSVLGLLPKLMERCGRDQFGSITAFFTILVEGDDMSDPIADQSRSILDGHIILSRELAQNTHFPPIDILSSASRLRDSLISKEHKELAQKFQQLYSILRENELLIRLGSYVPGSDKELDLALSKKVLLEDFLKQNEDEKISLKETIEALKNILIH
ncbi:MAG: flagellar protein export ATPase FliI [Helicobacter sp.]|mgnify:CR=1 FL=1|nr:flagellar protein export ATPase FliI [Helicobacter sp.]